MSAQLLTGATGVPQEAVTSLVGVQAQAPGPARLALRPRTSGATAAAVDEACADGTLVRTWAMRGTLHMLASRDVRWIVGLLGPVMASAGRRRREQLGLDENLCERAFAALGAILGEGPPLVRAELVGRLRAAGVDIDPETQQPPHLLAYAAARGLIFRGPDTPQGEPTYVLLDDHIPTAPTPERADALAELARRYLAGYGPATAADFRAWSGLPAGEAKQAFGAVDTRAVTAAGRPLAVLAGTDLDRPPPPPRLLGHFDPLLLGYADRSPVLDPAHAKRVQAGGGFLRPIVVVDGRVVGTWSLDRKRAKATANVTPFAALPRRTHDALAQEAADLSRFLGYPVDVVPPDGSRRPES